MLALLEYFWNWDSLTPPPTSVSTETIVILRPGAGSGKSRMDDYRPMTDDEWNDRFAMMREDSSKEVHYAPPKPATRAPTSQQVLAREAALELLRRQLAQAPSLEVLKAIAEQIQAIKATR